MNRTGQTTASIGATRRCSSVRASLYSADERGAPSPPGHAGDAAEEAHFLVCRVDLREVLPDELLLRKRLLLERRVPVKDLVAHFPPSFASGFGNDTSTAMLPSLAVWPRLFLPFAFTVTSLAPYLTSAGGSS